MDRRSALRVLSSVASEQAGFLTARQARLVDVAPGDLVRLHRSGDLLRHRRGIYEISYGRPTNPHQDLIAAWLSVDGGELPWRAAPIPRGVVSHQSAAALHDLGTIIPGLPEITTATQIKRKPDMRLHTARFVTADWSWFDLGGIRVPVTTPERTIVDLLLDGEEIDYLERALTQVFRDRERAEDGLISVALRRRGPSRRNKLIGDLRSLVGGAGWSVA